MSVISRLESECARILSRLRRLEEMPVPAAAKLMKKSPELMTGLFSFVSSGAGIPPPGGGNANGNTAEGTQALFSNTTGNANTAIGVGALYKKTLDLAESEVPSTTQGPQPLFQTMLVFWQRLREQRCGEAVLGALC
jgi:hypothetical protein